MEDTKMYQKLEVELKVLLTNINIKIKTLVNYQSVAIKVVMGIDNTTEINILMNIKNPYIVSYKKYFVEDISTCDGIL